MNTYHLKCEFQYGDNEFEVKLNILKETNKNLKFIYSNGCKWFNT